MIIRLTFQACLILNLYAVTSSEVRHVTRDVITGWRKKILEAFNEERASMEASDMRRLDWSRELEATASVWSKLCSNESNILSSNPSAETNENPGYLLYTWNPRMDAGPSGLAESKDMEEVTRRALEHWSKQKPHVITCDQQNPSCAAYKQIVFSKVSQFGCSVGSCRIDRVRVLKQSEEFKSLNNFSLLICVFNVGLSSVDEGPFRRGRACTTCPLESPFCYKSNFCVENCPIESALGDCDCRITQSRNICMNGGTFLSHPLRCRCACPFGWTGLDCSARCLDDNQNNCRSLYEQNLCDSLQAQSVCPVTCGNCVPEDTIFSNGTDKWHQERVARSKEEKESDMESSDSRIIQYSTFTSILSFTITLLAAYIMSIE